MLFLRYNTPVFSSKRVKTYEMFLEDLYAKYSSSSDDSHDDVSGASGHAIGGQSQTGGWLAQRRRATSSDEDSKKDAFVKLGQTIKLESVLRGEVSYTLDQSRRRGSSDVGQMSSSCAAVAANAAAAACSPMRGAGGGGPTSPSSSPSAKAFWEPVCIFPNFRHQIVCGDSWANAHLVIGTADDGAFLIAHRHPPVKYIFIDSKKSSVS
jgi:hypothetical protein